MIRLIIFAAALTAVGIASAGPGVKTAAFEPQFPPATVEMTLKRVSEHVYYAQGEAGIATENQGFISNAGVMVTGNGVVVFDSLGTPALAELLVQTDSLHHRSTDQEGRCQSLSRRSYLWSAGI